MTTERFLEVFISVFALPLGVILFAFGFAFLYADGTGKGSDNGIGRRLLIPSIPLIMGGIGGLLKGGRWFRPVFIGALTFLWAALDQFPAVLSGNRYWACLGPVGIPIILAIGLIAIPASKPQGAS
jgi:hypothetical protein